MIGFWAVAAVLLGAPPEDPNANNARPPKNDADLKFWLENMVWGHGFSIAEIQTATGLKPDAIKSALARFKITAKNAPKPKAELMRVVPYPGGRHPRIGFLDGAIRPQRETKISVFTPWDARSYVVVDVPEAIWSNLGLTYLAHTHVPTIFDKQKITLKKQEWERRKNGELFSKRRLPNRIEFTSLVRPRKDHVAMSMTLFNGTKKPLSKLRVQNCVMLKAALGFNAQTNKNKVFRGEYVACKDKSGTRWVITAWKPLHRGWANPPCPCLHSDPKFPDCAPGKTVRIDGWLSFYEGKDIQAEIARIEKLGWWRAEKRSTSR